MARAQTNATGPSKYAPRRYYINIIHDPDLKYEKYKYTVQPGHQHLDEGDTVVFKNRGNIRARINIPDGNLLFGPGFIGFDLDPFQESPEFTVQNTATEGRYFYSVYCENGQGQDYKGFAEGGTSPGMIVDP